ncbi:AN1-type zinc finger protein 2A [Ochotona princeps]|uniref:AN1-type zinc finger protein 2A n=1 Tax=Ochotona princeps TaxID=9978 RepID=UPI00032B003C|nr:AN1-type zinc finger protein 2A [Ochotona princeps]
MEFPDLGKHCSEKTCRRLDFLPLRCSECHRDFCKDHFTCAAHSCPLAFQKDVRVPVCPLCHVPVPVRRGQVADVVVGEHMDGGCRSRPGKSGEKVFTFRCSREGCKRKELLPVACAQCRAHFCIRHRHPLDHRCGRPAVTAC